MTTRSRQHFKQHSTPTDMEATTAAVATTATATTAMDLTALVELMRSMMQDREQQIAEEKRFYEDTERRIRRQLEILQDLVKSPVTATSQHRSNIELTRLSENNDIKAYLTTFERVMQAHEI